MSGGLIIAILIELFRTRNGGNSHHSGGRHHFTVAFIVTVSQCPKMAAAKILPAVCATESCPSPTVIAEAHIVAVTRVAALITKRMNSAHFARCIFGVRAVIAHILVAASLAFRERHAIQAIVAMIATLETATLSCFPISISARLAQHVVFTVHAPVQAFTEFIPANRTLGEDLITIFAAKLLATTPAGKDAIVHLPIAIVAKLAFKLFFTHLAAALIVATAIKQLVGSSLDAAVACLPTSPTGGSFISMAAVRCSREPATATCCSIKKI